MYELYRKLLNQFIAFQSISTDPDHKVDMLATVDWLKRQFESNGFEVKILEGDNTNPVVLARFDGGQTKTTLVYGHYDVQPAAMEQGWTGDPFTVREQNGRLLARGAVDNKGQVLVHMVSVFEHIKNASLGTNVLFMIEGNEETSNPDLPALLAKYKDYLECDEVLVSDGEIVGSTPTIDVSLRGGFNIRLTLRTAANDMHSGLAGGAVPNAAQELVRLVASVHDNQGRVAIPNFYKGITQPTPDALKQHAQLVKTNPPESSLGVLHLLSANGTDFYTQTGLYPTIQISGISSGYTGEGFANIVPAEAELRLNVRTVAGQDTKKVSHLIKEFLLSKTTDYAQVEISIDGLHKPVQLATDSIEFKRVEGILKKVYGSPPIMKYVGGAIPIVLDFKEQLGVAPLLVSLGNDDCRMHGPDENFKIDLIKKGLEFSHRFFGLSGADVPNQLE